MSDEGLFEPGVFAMMTDYLNRADGSPTRALRLAVADLIAAQMQDTADAIARTAAYVWTDAEGRVLAAEWVPGSVVGIATRREDIARLIENQITRWEGLREAVADV